MSKKVYIILILILSLSIRLIGIRWGLPNKEHFYPYYSDEYTVLFVLQKMEPEKLNFDPGTYPPDPVFHYYLIGVLNFFGSKLGVVTLTKDKRFYLENPDEYAKIYLIGRYLSVFMGLLTVFVVYLIGKKAYSAKVGLLSALFLSIVPLHVIYSKIMNVAVPVTFWIVLTMFFITKIFETGKTRWYILTGITTGLAIGTKYTALLLPVIILVAHLLSERKFCLKKILVSYCFMSISFFMSNPYAMIRFHQFVDNFFRLRAPIVIYAGGGGPHPFHYPLTCFLPYGCGLPLLILCLCGVVFAIFNKTKYDILLVTWIFCYYFIMARSGMPAIRYQNELIPFLLLLGGRFAFCEFGQNWLMKYIRIIVILVICAVTFIRTAVCLSLLNNDLDTRAQASRWIIANVGAGTKIGVPKEPSESSPPIINMQYYSTTRYIDRPYTGPKYEIVNLKWSSEVLLKENPEYIVFYEGEYEYLPFNQDKMFKVIIDKNYTVIKQFEIQPKFLFFNFKNKKYPQWIINHQKILIFKKINK